MATLLCLVIGYYYYVIMERWLTFHGRLFERLSLRRPCGIGCGSKSKPLLSRDVYKVDLTCLGLQIQLANSLAISS